MQDKVGYDQFSYKVNAISLMQFSDELKTLCVNSSGKQVQITEQNQIYAYSSSGMETIYQD